VPEIFGWLCGIIEIQRGSTVPGSLRGGKVYRIRRIQRGGPRNHKYLGGSAVLERFREEGFAISQRFRKGVRDIRNIWGEES
jgi:hypothetical protein